MEQRGFSESKELFGQKRKTYRESGEESPVSNQIRTGQSPCSLLFISFHTCPSLVGCFFNPRG